MSRRRRPRGPGPRSRELKLPSERSRGERSADILLNVVIHTMLHDGKMLTAAARQSAKRAFRRLGARSARSEELLDRLDAMVNQSERPALGTGELGRRIDAEPLVDRCRDLGSRDRPVLGCVAGL